MRLETLASVATAMALSAALAEPQPFERYQSIIDRQMFGPLPPGFDPTKLPSEVQKSSSASEKQLTQEQEKLQKSVHFSVINVAADGSVVVGFSDNSDPKAPKHHYLKVGETADGWKVESANSEDATMTLSKDGVTLDLKLGDKTGGGSSKASANAEHSSGKKGLLGGSLRARRQAKEAENAAVQAQLAQRAAEERRLREEREAEEKEQREQERAEQRQQLLTIQEELRKAREAREARAASEDDTTE